MTGRILLLGLVLGVAGVAYASGARAFPVFEPAHLLDRTMPDAALLPVGSKRHGIHRGFGGGHKGFHGRRFHKGFHGHRFHKGFHGHRLFAGKRLPHGGVFFRHRFVDPGFSFGLRFRHGDVFFRQRFADRGFLFGHRFGHGGSGLFLGDRFGHRPSLFDRHFEHRPSLFGRRFQHR
jgi:hypothetical protein